MSDFLKDRMRGFHSYNVLDSPEFIQAKKIERRIMRYDKKVRARQVAKLEKFRNEALTSAAQLAAGAMSGQQSPTNQSLSQALRN